MFHCLVIKVLCLSVSQTARLLYHIHQCLSSTFFKFFRGIFWCLCVALKRLVYSITSLFPCQQLFSLFSKLFKLFIQKKQFLVTAQLEYHFLTGLSTLFYNFFRIDFDCPCPCPNKPIKTKQLSATIKLKFILNIPLPQRELLSVAKLRE